MFHSERSIPWRLLSPHQMEMHLDGFWAEVVREIVICDGEDSLANQLVVIGCLYMNGRLSVDWDTWWLHVATNSCTWGVFCGQFLMKVIAGTFL